MRIRDRIHRQVVAYVQRWSEDSEVVPNPMPPQLQMSEHSYDVPRVMAFGGVPGSPVSIDRYCSVNHTVRFMTNGLHPAAQVTTYPFRSKYGIPGPIGNHRGSKGPITVGCDVWIGFDAMVLSGVTIGHGAIVAARAVVTKDVPPYAIVAGTPATIRDWRFDEPTREALLRIGWFNWDHDKVLAHVDQICSDDVAGFVRRHDPAGTVEPCPVC